MNEYALTRRDLFTSNLPSTEKTALSRVLSRLGGSYGAVKSTVVSSHAMIREGIESAVVGAVIGAAEGKFGADIAVPFTGSKDGNGNVTGATTVPVEVVAAVVGYGGALMFPDEEVAPTLRHGGNVAVALWSARAAHNFVAKNWSGTVSVEGGATQQRLPAWNGEPSMGVDRIAQMARSFR